VEKAKSDTITIRLDTERKEKLLEESENKQISLNTLINQVLSRHVEWEEIGFKLGWITLSKRIVKAFASPLDKKTILQLAQTVGKTELRNSLQFAYGDINYDNAIALLERWMRNNYLKYSHTFEAGKSKYAVQHYLGKNWSIFFIEVIDSTFQDFGFKLEQKNAEENSCSFDIVKMY